MSELQVLLGSDTSQLPSRGSEFAAGLDLYASEDFLVLSRDRAMIDTGICVCIPEGCYGRVAPRSSLAAKHGLDVGAGVCDSDYRGPIKVILFNHSGKDYQVKQGDRIAQMIITPYVKVKVVKVEELKETDRGHGGFGSTGV
jgi:dUTP pyrophosphatase